LKRHHSPSGKKAAWRLKGLHFFLTYATPQEKSTE
jgi:hypothetical protein